MDQPTASDMLRALDPLIGEWVIDATGPDGEPWPGQGRASFEWHPSKAHVVQRTVTDVPGAPDSTSIIGCDAANGSYVQLYSDNRGVCRVYAMRLAGNEWTLQREGESFAQRFVATISEDARTISGRWDKTYGADFAVDFYLTYHKVVEATHPPQT